MASQEEDANFGRDDTRRDTPFKANAEVRFTDPGGQNRDDTRHDHPAKA